VTGDRDDRGRGLTRRGIPPSIKALAVLWLALWLPLHLQAYPASSFLWFCAYGNVLVVAGLCLESAWLLSWQAVALIGPQLVYALDALTVRQGTAYLFDTGVAPEVRALSLFHFVVPVLLVWSVRRLGYDRRALAVQTITSTLVLTTSFAAFRDEAINVAWSSAHPIAHWLCALAAWPLLFHLPVHVLLSRGSTLPRAHRGAIATEGATFDAASKRPEFSRPT
jgi:hypothetical protein